MAQVISAQEGALRKGAQAVGTAKAGIEQKMNTVRGEIEQVSGYWSGAAATSFTQLLNAWDEQTRKLNNVLITLQESLEGTEKDQAATEQEHQSTISNLGSIMSGF